MLAVFYQFNKRVNSLKTPTNADQTISGEVALKQATSYKTPTLTFACSAEDMPKARLSNYLAFDNKYYWVTNTMQISNSHIQFECKLDVLATYKNEILLSKAYVVYSDSQGRLDLTDSRASGDINMSCKDFTISFNDLFTKSPKFILSVISSIDSSGDFSVNYMLDDVNVNKLRQKLTDQDFIDYAKQILLNPYDYIIRGQTTAINVDNTILREIYLGKYDTTCVGRPLSNENVLRRTGTVSNFHKYNDYRGLEPYTTYSLYLPFVGIIQLDSTAMSKSNDLIVDCFASPVTGDVAYGIYVDSGSEAVYKIATYSGNCNNSSPVANTQVPNGLSTVSGAVISIAAVLASEGVSAAVTATKIGVGAVSFAHGMTQHTSINGSISTNVGANLGLNPVLYRWTTDTSENPENRRGIDGLPYCSTVVLNTLTGYVQTMNASISIAADYDEIQEVNDLLNGGVYIE